MRRVFLLITCLGASALLLHSWGRSQDSREPGGHPPAPLPAPPVRDLPRIAGIPYEEVLAIVKRHRGELQKIPGVTAVSFGEEGMIVYIRDPEVQKHLPSAIEGLPVKAEVLPTLPPPAGVIVLRPNGVREQADACPKGLPVRAREPMGVAIDGIPVLDVEAIFVRAQEYFGTVPGVLAVRLGPGGDSRLDGVVARQ